MYEILNYPDQGLKRHAKPVQDVSAVQNVIQEMFATHYHAKNCAALAATQLNIPNAPAITVIDFSASHDQPLCLINPKIIQSSGEQYEKEGCMSVFPGLIEAKVKRAMNIVVTYLDRDGQSQTLEAEGFMAKCIQHELDHLQGMLYLNRLSQLKKDKLLKRMKKHQLI